jgi:hypothetical protein
MWHGREYAAAVNREFPSVMLAMEQLASLDVGDLYDAYDAAFNRLDEIARFESRGIHRKEGGLVTGEYMGRACALKNESGAVLVGNPTDQ